MSKDLTAQDIKRIRRKYGLTQQGFARLLGLDVYKRQVLGFRRPAGRRNKPTLRAALAPHLRAIPQARVPYTRRLRDPTNLGRQSGPR